MPSVSVDYCCCGGLPPRTFRLFFFLLSRLAHWVTSRVVGQLPLPYTMQRRCKDNNTPPRKIYVTRGAQKTPKQSPFLTAVELLWARGNPGVGRFVNVTYTYRLLAFAQTRKGRARYVAGGCPPPRPPPLAFVPRLKCRLGSVGTTLTGQVGQFPAHKQVHLYIIYTYAQQEGCCCERYSCKKNGVLMCTVMHHMIRDRTADCFVIN